MAALTQWQDLLLWRKAARNHFVSQAQCNPTTRETYHMTATAQRRNAKTPSLESTAAIQDSSANWLEKARSAAHQAPLRPRLPLLWSGQIIGTVAEGFFEETRVDALQGQRITLQQRKVPGLGYAWNLTAPDLTVALKELAEHLRRAKRCGPWRNEQIAVTTPQGQRVATVERGAVRVLGVATRAVHLVGNCTDGRMWVQQRSLSKPNDPGQWDTLMGGMVGASDSLEHALARETQEEAGLDVTQLPELVHGGAVEFTCPSTEGGRGVGYMRERIDWFSATVPEGVEPINQDGEVAQFQCIDRATLLQWLVEGRFTTEATLVLAAYLQL